MHIIELFLLLLILGLLVVKEKPRLNIPKNKRQDVILDSCTLIDGRVVDILQSGFLGSEVIVPQFIISELQLLADGNDAHKRERARFGLDIIKKIQDDNGLRMIIDRTTFANTPLTDDKLIALAKKMNAKICTTDFNLEKVATIDGIKVLNINLLAQSLRPVSLPGERLTVKILQKGTSAGQGIGYLDDGTMVVVEKAGAVIGKLLRVQVESMRQTSAGKMIFAKPIAVREQKTPSLAEKLSPKYRLKD